MIDRKRRQERNTTPLKANRKSPNGLFIWYERDSH
jgi:hypothetical protein